MCCFTIFLGSPFCIFERFLDSNPESCRSKQPRYPLSSSHPSPSSLLYGDSKPYMLAFGVEVRYWAGAVLIVILFHHTVVYIFYCTAPVRQDNYQCTCCLRGAVRLDLEGGVIHNEGRMKGWALKSRPFWAQKSRDFRAYPFKRLEKWISPNPNPYVQSHINRNRCVMNSKHTCSCLQEVRYDS